MKTAKRKDKTPDRVITMPDKKYHPTKAQRGHQIDMPGASLKTIRRAFFGPVKIRKEG